ncbi:MAG: methionine--tRNA ligase [Bacillota bacterium]
MADNRERFYITTPIYYPSANLHIGHSYTTVAADALSRYHRFRGHDTWFLTGTDEHGQNIERRAESVGKTPQEYVDGIVTGIKRLWSTLHISYDDFIRTTEPRHERVVQQIFQQLHDQGDIYKSEYEGWYCTGCEAFYTETQVKEWPDKKCPDHDRPVEWVKEESYFFRLSKYADRLLAHIEATPDFIQPPTRRNEIVSFIKQGLEDLCVSRTTFTWGIPVPFDPKHVIYVWVDALSNYITAIGYNENGPGQHGPLWERFWPADVHLIGKDILRFHTIIWPILLMALDLPLPKKVFGHGWVLLQSGKMSKTRGNVVDPLELVAKYGVDPIRYYLLREVPFGQDGTYSEEALVLRTNVDLANDLGNLLSRTTQMVEKFAGGAVPALPAADDDGVLRDLAGEVVGEYEAALDRLDLPSALAAIWRLVNRANKYIDETAPWNLAKAPAGDTSHNRLAAVLYNLVESLRLSAVLLVPFLVETPERIWAQLGLPGEVRTSDYDAAVRWGGTPAATRIARGQPLFPRIDLKAREAAAAAEAASGTAPGRASEPAAAPASAPASAPTAAGHDAAEGVVDLISIDDFAKVQLRVAEIVAAEKVEKADKLLKLQVRMGEETRQIVSGIAKHYTPESLVGKRIVVVANLKPVKLRGIESAGMLLAASNEDRLTLVTTDAPIASGARVK